MNECKLKEAWLAEEAAAQMHGWDFSHIHSRYEESESLPWDYRSIVLSHLTRDAQLLDMGTGGGEFLLTLNHPPRQTAVTEGYPPNAQLCRETLAPLGIRVAEVDGDAPLPFPAESFDLVINRHESYDPAEVRRILRPGGLFITQQVGEDNDRELAQLLLPGLPKPFPGHNAAEQAQRFRDEGFDVLRQEEAYGSIRFCNVGALVWFARIIPWEFEGFSVERCFPQLMEAQRLLTEQGSIGGRTHRFLIVAQKACKGAIPTDELSAILEKFAASGWELIAKPAQAWLKGSIATKDLIAAIRQADAECGACGCEFDPLYKRALELL